MTDETKKAMKAVLTDIQQGKFARDFILENQSNSAFMTATRRNEAQHPIEVVGGRASRTDALDQEVMTIMIPGYPVIT